jgi:hypothetical protein
MGTPLNVWATQQGPGESKKPLGIVTASIESISTSFVSLIRFLSDSANSRMIRPGKIESDNRSEGKTKNSRDLIYLASNFHVDRGAHGRHYNTERDYRLCVFPNQIDPALSGGGYILLGGGRGRKRRG